MRCDVMCWGGGGSQMFTRYGTYGVGKVQSGRSIIIER